MPPFSHASSSCGNASSSKSIGATTLGVPSPKMHRGLNSSRMHAANFTFSAGVGARCVGVATSVGRCASASECSSAACGVQKHACKESLVVGSQASAVLLLMSGAAVNCTSHWPPSCRRLRFTSLPTAGGLPGHLRLCGLLLYRTQSPACKSQHVVGSTCDGLARDKSAHADAHAPEPSLGDVLAGAKGWSRSLLGGGITGTGSHSRQGSESWHLCFCALITRSSSSSACRSPDVADSTDDESTRNESAGPGTHAHAPTAQRHDGSDPSGGRVSSILKVPPVVVALTSLSCDAPAAGEGCMVCCCEARAVACESVLSRSSRARPRVPSSSFAATAGAAGASADECCPL